MLQQVPDLRQHRPGGIPHRRQRLPGLLRVLLHHLGRHPGVEANHRNLVRHRIVQIPGNPQPLLRDPPGRLGLAGLLRPNRPVGDGLNIAAVHAHRIAGSPGKRHAENRVQHVVGKHRTHKMPGSHLHGNEGADRHGNPNIHAPPVKQPSYCDSDRQQQPRVMVPRPHRPHNKQPHHSNGDKDRPAAAHQQQSRRRHRQHNRKNRGRLIRVGRVGSERDANDHNRDQHVP